MSDSFAAGRNRAGWAAGQYETAGFADVGRWNNPCGFSPFDNMLMTRAALLAAATVVVLSVSHVHAQVAERTVGEEQFGGPLTITGLSGHELGRLAMAAGTPMGFEAAVPSKPSAVTVGATGRKLRQVLDELMASDGRYEWRDEDGVIVVRPRSAWRDPLSVFNTVIGPIHREDMRSADAATLVAKLFGAANDRVEGPGDTVKFSVDIPGGGTLLSALNAIVRAHGTMTWSLEPTSAGPVEDFPLSMSLFVGGAGAGAGIPKNAAIAAIPPAGPRTIPSERHASVLDITVGTAANGKPLVIRGALSLSELAQAVRVPMGLEKVSTPAAIQGDGVRATGLALRDALQIVTTIDPRYAWREMDGVVVLRPVDAWNDASSPLFSLVTNLHAENVTVDRAIGILMARLGDQHHVNNFFPDTRRITLDLPQGSVLEALNHLVRSHGELCWEWSTNSTADRRFFSGRRFTLKFSFFNGSGYGFAIP